ncbi:hypothetical protein PINS_up006243 [Pythium insidiosum]|nr:hypothetical protein PINS_up006243 [Pythium insidiosum]
MAQLRTRIHALHAELESASFPSPMMLDSRLSWSSMEDTDSDSDREVGNYETTMRRKTLRKMPSMSHSDPATPLPIPARTHDFGWCDRDDLREAREQCACGNDCDEFFACDEEDAHALSFSMSSRQTPADDDDMIFDMEM